MAGFTNWLRGQHYAPATIRAYHQYVRRAFTAVGPLLQATTTELVAWLDTLPPSLASRAQGRKALLAYYRWKKVKPCPADDIPAVPQAQGLPRPLSETDHLRWVTAARQLGDNHELAGLLMATTGARITEVRKARWDDIDIGAATWRVRGKGTNRRGPSWRQQPLHHDMVDILRRQTRTSEWVFPGSSGPVCDGTMRGWLLEIGFSAGLGRVTPHRIRHTVATVALTRSRDLRAVQQFLGHKSISSTQIYTQVLPGRLREIVDSLPA